jgi:hypothetical protein
MGDTQTSVREVIPEIGGNFELDQSVLNGSCLFQLFSGADGQASFTSGRPPYRSNELWHSCLDQSSTRVCCPSRWLLKILLFEGSLCVLVLCYFIS